MRPVWVLALALFPALAQGYEVGAFGLGGQATFYLRLFGEVPLEGGRFAYALAPYCRPGLGEAGLDLERLYLVAEAGEVSLTLGRFPYTFGEGRLFPYTWSLPSPAGGEAGVWGGFLTLYGEGRLRLGYAWGPGVFAEAAWGDLRALASSGGVGVAGSARVGEGVVYGEVLGLSSGPRALGGFSAVLGGGQGVLEFTYPWGWGAGWFGGWEGVGVSIWVARQGEWTWGVGLSGEAWRLSLAAGGGVWRWLVGWRGAF